MLWLVEAVAACNSCTFCAAHTQHTLVKQSKNRVPVLDKPKSTGDAIYSCNDLSGQIHVQENAPDLTHVKRAAQSVLGLHLDLQAGVQLTASLGSTAPALLQHVHQVPLESSLVVLHLEVHQQLQAAALSLHQQQQGGLLQHCESSQRLIFFLLRSLIQLPVNHSNKMRCT